MSAKYLRYLVLIWTITFLQGQGYAPEVQNDLEIQTSECPIAFHQIGGKCYFYGYFKLNWFRAMEFCHSFGESVSLACIETPEENEHLKNWLISNGDHTTGVWVGGSDNGHVGRWAWFPTGQLIQDFNWGPSQPNGGDQHCMYIVGGYLGYQWADFHCGFEMTFLCEYQVNEVEAWRRRRQMVQFNSNKTRDNTLASSAPLSVRYGFMKKPETSRVPKETKKSVTVTQKPYRNSVVISTNKVETNEIINQQQPEKQSDDSTVFNFLKSIIKFG